MIYFLKYISAILPHSSGIVIVFVIKVFAGEKCCQVSTHATSNKLLSQGCEPSAGFNG